MRIALAQYSMAPDMDSNLEKVLDFLQRGAAQQANLVIFPELCLSPFFPQYPGQDVTAYALPLGEDRIERMRRECRRLGIAASPNIYLRDGGRRFDASLLIDERGEVVGVSKMVHIAQLPCFYEQDYYAPSDTGFRVYETSLGKIGIVVCFDRHFPESIRTCAVRGASLILIPTANTTDEPGDLFESELRAAAMQNGVYIAMCNRVGRESEVTFCGESIIVDPDGNTLVKADGAEQLVIREIDLSLVAVARSKRPYLALRRPETYE